MFKRSMVLGYICLVGIPLLALIGILDAGHDVVAPIPVGGNWDLQADFSPLAASPCGAQLQALRQPVLAISQSGMYLDLAIDRIHGSGRLEKTALTAAISPRPADRSCGENPIYLKASLIPASGNNLFEGTLGVDGCSSCSAVNFRAVRRPPSRKTER